MNLARTGATAEVGDEVSSARRAVADNGGPAGAVSEGDGVEGLAEGSDLVQLDENAVSGPFINAALDALGVRDQQVVADELDGGAEALDEDAPAGPVVLGEAILDGGDGIAFRPAGPVIDEPLAGQRAALLLKDVFPPW